MKDQKTLPLLPIELSSKPLNQRALAWSSDAELAVAADDSVHVFFPEFPVIHPHSLPENGNLDTLSQLPAGQRRDAGGISVLPAGLSSTREHGGEDNEDELLSSDSEADAPGDQDPDFDGDVEMGEATHHGNLRGAINNRQQFADCCRQITVSRPALAPEINAHIWKVAGKGMPVMHAGVTGQGGAVPNNDDSANGLAAEPVNELNPHPGAGIGVIGSAGSSLNHVVAIEWSPAGSGRNRRPVLAVLTACGSLVIYGEGSPLPFGGTARPIKGARPKGQPAVRNLETWLALWAVGENFVVPGQEEYGYGEYIKAFAWCQEIGPGKALLAYMNDLRELVILCVGTAFNRLGDGLEEATWNVKEILRVETSGPHGQADIFDPDFLPGGSSYSMRWSPWLKDGATWSCLLAYMDSNYVGFRKITLDAAAWVPTETPVLKCDPHDWSGRCLHLGVDAFLEFENTVWNFDDRKVCRGFIATPWVAEPFEVDLVQSNPHRPKPGHSTDDCKSTYPAASMTNPITGLVVHPVDLQTVSPYVIPLYTAVRFSATATNNNHWWESSVPQRRSQPQWATEIQSKINATVPLDAVDPVGDGGSESGDDGIEHDRRIAKKSDNEDQSEDEDEENNDDANGIVDGGGGGSSSRQGQVDAYTSPEAHPLRMHLWGLATSPGGGATAVLASTQNTHKPERGTWMHHRSQILFGFSPRHGAPGPTTGGEDSRHDDDEGDDHHAADVDGLSTEARLWEWLYGSGPGVPALTYYASPPTPPHAPSSATMTTTTNPRVAAHHAREVEAHARRGKIKALFTSLVAGQTCGVCADGQTGLLRPNDDDNNNNNNERLFDCACEKKGHRFAVCAASGLAIMEPGVSRCCGVCQARCLDVARLTGLLAAAGKAGEAEVVRNEVNGDVCVQCGGKYLD